MSHSVVNTSAVLWILKFPDIFGVIDGTKVEVRDF